MSSSSDLSELTSAIDSEEEPPKQSAQKGKLDHYFKNGAASAQALPTLKKKRPPSPPHDYVLADNPDIAFICMFRSRFGDALPKSLPHYGPQDIESGVAGSVPGDHVERLLCALLSLVLNRKKDIERGHYTRGLEEAIHGHTVQWPAAWQGKNPLHGGGSFNTMTPEQRLTLMKALVIWSLDSSDAVKAIIKESYKQARHEDDLNQPLSVQSWGRDGDKRRFWLIEGQDDTHFRLYRESNPALKTSTWRSIAGTIEEVTEVANKLGEENTQASRRLRDRIMAAVPRFEAGEEKRRRRDYRLAQKARFTRPEPGFSLYEGRTRGKRVRYDYSEDGLESDDESTRRSTRRSGLSTPAEPTGPTYTASGRQVRSRHGGNYGESSATNIRNGDDESKTETGEEDDNEHDSEEPRGRSRTNGAKTNGSGQAEELSLSDDGGTESDEAPSENEWDGGGDDDDDEVDDQELDESDEDLLSDKQDVNDVEMGEEHTGARGDDDSDAQSSLVVSLRYSKTDSSPAPTPSNTTAAPQNHPTTNGTKTDEDPKTSQANSSMPIAMDNHESKSIIPQQLDQAVTDLPDSHTATPSSQDAKMHGALNADLDTLNDDTSVTQT